MGGPSQGPSTRALDKVQREQRLAAAGVGLAALLGVIAFYAGFHYLDTHWPQRHPYFDGVVLARVANEGKGGIEYHLVLESPSGESITVRVPPAVFGRVQVGDLVRKRAGTPHEIIEKKTPYRLQHETSGSP